MQHQTLPHSTLPLDIDIDKPRYDQDTFNGRLRHFLVTVNPLNIFVSSRKLENAKNIVLAYKLKSGIPENLTVDELWRAKWLYDSAYHPTSGEKMPLLGRMSAQVPMNMLITGGMMCFYKSTAAVIFWQWINQSFNAIVNYTNRGGDSEVSDKQLTVSYICATTGAVVTALGLNRLLRRAPPLVGRFVPFAAVAAANCVNIPLMRSQELRDGVPVCDRNGNKLGYSRKAAKEGILQVIFSRVMMAAPGMALTPVIMNHLERRGTLCRYPWINLPTQIALLGFFLTFATPMCCALFKQRAEIAVARLEEPLRTDVIKMLGVDCHKYVYYNKGL